MCMLVPMMCLSSRLLRSLVVAEDSAREAVTITTLTIMVPARAVRQAAAQVVVVL